MIDNKVIENKGRKNKIHELLQDQYLDKIADKSLELIDVVKENKNIISNYVNNDYIKNHNINDYLHQKIPHIIDFSKIYTIDIGHFLFVVLLLLIFRKKK